MAREAKATIQNIGDFGNPKGNGLGGITLGHVADWDRATMETKATAFHAAMVSAQLTAGNMGDVVSNYRLPAFADKPAAGVNIDRVVVCQWRQKSASKVYEITIDGVPLSSTSLEEKDEGERLNDAGKAAMAAAIDAMYDFTADEDKSVVLSGVVYQKK